MKNLQNDKDLEKFKRVKAIIDGTAKPIFPTSKSSAGGASKSKSNGTMKKSGNSAFKKMSKSNNKKKAVVQEDEDDEDDDQYNNVEEDDDNGGDELNSYKLPRRFDDEEIDEEEAFNYDDEELTKSKTGKNYDDEFENEDFIDLDELLDEKEETSSVSTKQEEEEEQEEEQEEGESDDDDESDDDSLFSENEFSEPSEQEDGEEDETNTSNLLSIVKNLEKTNKSVGRSVTKLPDMTEKVGDESQFNIFPTADENGTIDINDLMSFIPEEFDQVKSQLEEIVDKQAISAPVSKYERDSIQRRITTEQAHRILTQWVPFVREQREKNLKFESKVTIANTAQSVAKNFGKTDLNDEISKALMESGAEVDSIQSTNRGSGGGTAGGGAKEVVDPVEEKRRLREIIKLRSIMYYQEIKDKRKKKIKSKKFRKIEKKKREKEIAKREEELMKLDPEYAKHKAEKLEERRVLERMTQRHKNNSKFMKNMLNNRGLSTEERRDINEHQKLAKELLLLDKMNSSNVNDEDSDDSGSDDDDDDDDDDDQSDDDDQPKSKIDLSDVDQKAMTDKERIQMKLQKLGRPTQLPDKGINAMKFMQKSMERELDDAIKKQNGKDDYEQAEEDEQEKAIEDSNRIIYHKQVASNKQNPSNKIMSSGLLVEKAGFSSGHKVSSDSSIQINGIKTESATTSKKQQKQQQQQQEQQVEEEELDEENPWLDASKKSKTKKSKKDKKKNSDEFLISLNNLNNGGVATNGGSSKSTNANASKEKVKNNDLPMGESSTQQQQQQKNTNSSNSNKRKLGEEEQPESKKSKKFVGMSLITSNKQKELLLEAFAKDNIEEEFIEEKKQLLEDDVPEEKSNFLPGWGSWIGDGTKQRDNSKREAALKRKREQKIKEIAKKRLDANSSRVIIDEKAPLEGVSKYVLNKLPQHYSNKEQYESTLSIAHGKDWNSTTAFKKLIEPKVSVLPGTFIKPVTLKDKQDFMLKKKEEKVKKSK